MSASSQGKVNNVNPLTQTSGQHYLHELPAQDEERLGKLFQKLDLDGNGRIDVHDLSRALNEVGVHERYAQVFIIIFFFSFYF